MHDNPAAAQAPVFALPQHRVVALSGRDAVAFAHAQFMNDVAALATGRWQWNGWLTPKGRVIALFALLRVENDALWLLLADAEPADLVARLQRFVFRSKVTIEARDDLLVSAAFASPALARGADMANPGDRRAELDLGGDGGPRVAWISQGAQAAVPGDPGQTERWMQADFAHGLPRLPPAHSEQWTPQQLSLERLRAYSVKKGCYPGQEVVARTHFLGQAKRGLVRLRCERAPGPGGEVTVGGAAAGRVVCAAGDELLAVMPPMPADVPPSLDGAPCAVLPLLAGLAR